MVGAGGEKGKERGGSKRECREGERGGREREGWKQREKGCRERVSTQCDMVFPYGCMILQHTRTDTHTQLLTQKFVTPDYMVGETFINRNE